MLMDQYQNETDELAVYPGEGEVFGLAYVALGLAGEAGELANKVKKILRGDMILSHEVKSDLAKELGDVLWYAARFACEIDYALGYVAEENLKKLKDRKERGVLKGHGDER